MYSQDWEPDVWQILENLDFPHAPASCKGRFSAQAPKPCWRRPTGPGNLTPTPGGAEWAAGRVGEHVGASPHGAPVQAFGWRAGSGP